MATTAKAQHARSWRIRNHRGTREMRAASSQAIKHININKL